MSLTKLFDDLDNLITNKRPLHEIKSVLTLLRDQAEALESDHLALNASHAKLIEEKSQVDREFAQLKASQPPPSPKTPPGDDFAAMENLPDSM